MALLKGDDKILYLYINPDWVPISCLTENSFSEQVDLIEVNIDQWAASRPTNQGYSISFAGIQDDASVLTYSDLKTIKRAKTLIQWKIQDVNTLAGETGYGFITSISESAPAGELLTFEGTIVGFGEPTVVVTTADIWQDGVGILFQDGVELVF